VFVTCFSSDPKWWKEDESMLSSDLGENPDNQVESKSNLISLQTMGCKLQKYINPGASASFAIFLF